MFSDVNNDFLNPRFFTKEALQALTRGSSASYSTGNPLSSTELLIQALIVLKNIPYNTKAVTAFVRTGVSLKSFITFLNNLKDKLIEGEAALYGKEKQTTLGYKLALNEAFTIRKHQPQRKLITLELLIYVTLRNLLPNPVLVLAQVRTPWSISDLKKLIVILGLISEVDEEDSVNEKPSHEFKFRKASKEEGYNFSDQNGALNEERVTGSFAPPSETVNKEKRIRFRNDSDNKKHPTLSKYATNLTELAQKGSLSPVVGRDKEIHRMIQILSRKTKNNPILVGKAGVGKTAVVEGLAQELLKPEYDRKRISRTQIFSLSLTGLISGTRFRGEFEERIKDLCDEITLTNSVNEGENIVLFIDEVHTIVGAGSSEGSLDANNILKPYLARGEMHIIGATTYDEYKKHIEPDTALSRRFQKISLPEPSINETITMLEGVAPFYENYHNVFLSEEALQAAVKLSNRYITDRALPDKAIDLIDEAGARLSLNNTLEADIKDLKQIIKQKYEKLDDNELAMQEINKLNEQLENLLSTKPVITEEHIAKIISETTGIPVTNISDDDATRFLHMEEALQERVIGQKQAIKAVADSIRRQYAGLKDPKRPIASFIFAGPTGTGKTELAKTLARFLFNTEKSLITFDMSDFSEKNSVTRLFGAPPGYIGYEEGGQLTEAVKRQPFSVILLDEIEKAHPETFNSLLQVLDEGRLVDAKGITVDFKNTVIIMTSNLGTNQALSGPTGFYTGGDNVYEYMKQKVSSALKTHFRPEFLNRLDDIIVFSHLTHNEVKQVVNIFVEELNTVLADKHIRILLDDNVIDSLIESGYSEVYGARPLKRTIQDKIQTPLSILLLNKTVKEGDIVKVALNEEKQVVFDVKNNLVAG